MRQNRSDYIEVPNVTERVCPVRIVPRQLLILVKKGHKNVESLGPESFKFRIRLVAAAKNEWFFNPLVPGSNPGGPTNIPKHLRHFSLSCFFTSVETFFRFWPSCRLQFERSRAGWESDERSTYTNRCRLTYMRCWFT